MKNKPDIFNIIVSDVNFLLEIENILHKNNYFWPGEKRNLIRNGDVPKRPMILTIGFYYKYTITYDENTSSRYKGTTFKYPEDKNKLFKFMGYLKPDYKPRILIKE